MMILSDNEVFAFVKTSIDVHTLGINMIHHLLLDCGYRSILAPAEIQDAIVNIKKVNNFSLFKRWLTDNAVTRIGFSYRLDPNDGLDYFCNTYFRLKDANLFVEDKGFIKSIFFAGLPSTCNLIQSKIGKKIEVFIGGETPSETLMKLGVNKSRIPKILSEHHYYDTMRWNFAKKLISDDLYKNIVPQDHYGYRECGTKQDGYIKRLLYAKKNGTLPIIRAHAGPYNPNRAEALNEFESWTSCLANSRLLDVLSIGTSQLTQSHFGENWTGLQNGGGVPINSIAEYKQISNIAKPMLVRTYAGTKNILDLAKIYEESLNICWHALSLWWFCEIDGRGTNTVLDNLKEHIETIKYIASINKPMEPNVPHHFAFRGSDDISYIISGYIAAKTAKKYGIKHLILQNMLNTPKYTIGVQDLAKGRTMLRLVKELEDSNFRISLQTRAGLDYFSPDMEMAKIQLADITALMDDIEPGNIDSPDIIHVVSYSEAIRLATPDVIIDSIKITLSALNNYRKKRSLGLVENMNYNKEVKDREYEMYEEAKDAIVLLEKGIPNLYTPQGLYKLFVDGFFPVPYLQDSAKKYSKATQWHTALKNGGIKVVDDLGNIINTVQRYKKILDL